SYVLNTCLRQTASISSSGAGESESRGEDGNERMEIQNRYERVSRTIPMPALHRNGATTTPRAISSQDDGGIRVLEWQPLAQRWTISNDAVALIEAKRAFGSLTPGGTGYGDARIREGALRPNDSTIEATRLVAQCAGEAIAAYMEHRVQSRGQ